MKSFQKILLTSVILVFLGGGGLTYIFLLTLPTLGPRWLFFFFFFLLVSGLSLPVISFLNYRFKGQIPIEPVVIVRETILLGICANLLAWLQMGRELTASLGLLIVVGFLLIELLLRLNERSRWKPDADKE